MGRHAGRPCFHRRKNSAANDAVVGGGDASGNGATASQLHHPIGGKTGTTNDFTDAWFLGFSPSVTCGVWVGYDDRQTLGDKETGARVALPIWIDFMKTAIAAIRTKRFPAKRHFAGHCRPGSVNTDASIRIKSALMVLGSAWAAVAS